MSYVSVTKAKEIKHIHTYTETQVDKQSHRKLHNHSCCSAITDKNFIWIVFSFIKTLNYNCNDLVDFQGIFPLERLLAFNKP